MKATANLNLYLLMLTCVSNILFLFNLELLFRKKHASRPTDMLSILLLHVVDEEYVGPLTELAQSNL